MGVKVKLPSGNEIEITPAPFDEAKAIYQALLEELKSVPVQFGEHHVNFLKSVFCTGIASKKIEKSVVACLDRVIYKGQKVTLDVFEVVENREDYLPMCFEVARVNVEPFMKTLTQQFSLIREKLETVLA